jgi:hypothetical protein
MLTYCRRRSANRRTTAPSQQPRLADGHQTALRTAPQPSQNTPIASARFLPTGGPQEAGQRRLHQRNPHRRRPAAASCWRSRARSSGPSSRAMRSDALQYVSAKTSVWPCDHRYPLRSCCRKSLCFNGGPQSSSFHRLVTAQQRPVGACLPSFLIHDREHDHIAPAFFRLKDGSSLHRLFRHPCLAVQ